MEDCLGSTLGIVTSSAPVALLRVAALLSGNTCSRQEQQQQQQQHEGRDPHEGMQRKADRSRWQTKGRNEVQYSHDSEESGLGLGYEVRVGV